MAAVDIQGLGIRFEKDHVRNRHFYEQSSRKRHPLHHNAATLLNVAPKATLGGKEIPTFQEDLLAGTQQPRGSDPSALDLAESEGVERQATGPDMDNGSK